FFGVKLHGEYVVAQHGRSKAPAIFGGADYMFAIVWHYIITVHKIEPAVGRHVLPQRVSSLLSHLIPAHVRNLAAYTIGMRGCWRKAQGITGKGAQCLDAFVFLGVCH